MYWSFEFIQVLFNGLLNKNVISAMLLFAFYPFFFATHLLIKFIKIITIQNIAYITKTIIIINIISHQQPERSIYLILISYRQRR